MTVIQITASLRRKTNFR